MQTHVISETALTTSVLRKFGLTLAVIFIGIFGCLLPWTADRAWPLWPFVTGGTLTLLAVLLPTLLRFIYIPWMKLGHGLGWVNTRIILGVIYFVLITPLGFIMRRFGYNPMANTFDPNVSTYRRTMAEKPIQHMEKPF